MAEQKQGELVARFYICSSLNIKHIMDNMPEATEQVWAMPRHLQLWEVSYTQMAHWFQTKMLVMGL
jgi:hypothetical protein